MEYQLHESFGLKWPHSTLLKPMILSIYTIKKFMTSYMNLEKTFKLILMEFFHLLANYERRGIDYQ